MNGAEHPPRLPQLDGGLFLTDGGLETTLIFHDGIDLPDFAAFDLLRRPGGEEVLRRYFRGYLDVAERYGLGFILESATWRASADWGDRLGYPRAALADANRRAIRMLDALRAEYRGRVRDTVISGCVGPRGDGYVPGSRMSEAEAHAYHAEQIGWLAGTAAEMVTAITMNYPAEAIGIVRAARDAGLPVAISFTIETDGSLPSGESLRSAIEQVDAATAGYAAYHMINCAHPTHFEHVLAAGEPWVERIRGVRANASCRSHAELNEASELDAGDPADLGRRYARLRAHLPKLAELGGCCGTDVRHVEEIAKACSPALP